MKPSVYIITCNQAAFLKQRINSVLVKKNNFDFEIVISDDCSTYYTQELLHEYQRK